MIDWQDSAVLRAFVGSFAEVTAEKARALTGMEFIVTQTNDATCEIITSHPEALNLEYGTVAAMGGSWSVKALAEAGRVFSE